MNFLTLFIAMLFSVDTVPTVKADTMLQQQQKPLMAVDTVLQVADTVLQEADTFMLTDTLRPMLNFNEDSIRIAMKPRYVYEDTYLKGFDPKPWKAVWWALLVPGGGQIYNRKYWKLPIVYGGFLGLIYGYNWNQRYYRTYQTAYREISTDIENKKLGRPVSANPTYLDLIRGGTLEQRRQYATQNETYLQNTFKNKKDTYRNWRDYCVVGMLGVYLVSIIDAYVDAALFKFDVTPELGVDGETNVMVNYSIDF